MMDLCYVISSLYEYNLISRDAGIPMANSLGIPYVELDDINNSYLDKILILDTRMQTPYEIHQIENLINQNFKIAFQIVDINQKEILNPFSGIFIMKMMHHNNVAIVSTYSRHGLSEILYRMYPNKWIHAPFVYEPNRELKLSIKNRDNSIGLSGFIDDEYPDRLGFLNRMYKELPDHIDRLRHPGYDKVYDEGAFVGDKYLEWVSSHRFFFVDGSKDNLELQKYNEAWYAGSLPVGILPDTYIKTPLEKCMIQINPFSYNFKYEVDNVLSISNMDISLRIEKARRWLRDNRSAEVIRSRLHERLNEIFQVSV